MTASAQTPRPTPDPHPSAIPEALSDLVGRPTRDIDTPALVIDLDAMERNLRRMADFTRTHGVRLRPHAKTHKSGWIARQQMAAGAVGVCVQKTAEALALAAAGVDDIYISNEVIAAPKLARVARLALELRGRGGRLAIAVDSELGVDALAQAMADAAAGAGQGVAAANVIDVFVEIDVGGTRCGTWPGEPALALARRVLRHRSLRFAGIQAYQNRAQHARTPVERAQAIASAVEAARSTRRLVAAAGIAVPLITGSGTGTFILEAASGVYGELQAGSYLFMDADYAANQPDPDQPVFEQALFVQSQVISRRVEPDGAGHAVCDAGHKSHAIDSGLPRVWGRPLQYANGGDEHGVLRLGPDELAEGARLPELGELIWLVPGHCDPTVNLHDFYIGVRGGLADGRVERIIAVDARGAIT